MEQPAALKQREFRSLLVAGLISDAGDWMLLIALPIVIYQLTGSALGTSVAFLAELAPGVVLAPLAGRLADRIDRRRLMLAVTLAQAVALAPLLLVGHRSGLVLVYGVIVIEAALTTLFDPAKNALLPTLLAPEQYVSGNSLVALATGAGRLAGGPLGGLLLAAGHLRLIVVVDAVSFAIAGCLIARLPSDAAGRRAATGRATSPDSSHAAGQTGSPDTARAGRRGLRVALRAPRVRGVLAVALVAEIAQGIFVVLFILFVARRLGGGAGEIGLLRGVQAVGAIAAGLVLSFVGSGSRAGRLAALGAIAFGVLDLMIWNAPLLARSEWLFAALFVAAGAPGVVMETGLISSLQLAISDRERGRAFGALTLVSNAGQAIGMIAAGLLAAPLGLMTLLNAQGCLYLVAGAIAAWALWRPVRLAVRVPARFASLGR